MIIYAPEADRDVDRLHRWLMEFGERSAEAFMVRLEIAERRIDTRPRAYRMLRDDETRRYIFHMNRRAYLIDYQIEETQIVILRVWHGRQARPE